jgi:hypothetical protein
MLSKESNHLRYVHSLLRKVFTALNVIYFNNFIFYYLIVILISLNLDTCHHPKMVTHFPSSETFKSVGIFRLDFRSKHSEVAIDALSLHPPTMSYFILP